MDSLEFVKTLIPKYRLEENDTTYRYFNDDFDVYVQKKNKNKGYVIDKRERYPVYYSDINIAKTVLRR